MTGLRTWIIASMAWLFLFYNVERLHEPINIASFVYAFAAAAAIAIVSMRPLRAKKGEFVWFHGGWLVLFLVLKASMGYKILGAGLPLTVTEICAIGGSVFLAHGIAANVSRVEKSAVEAMKMGRSVSPDSFYRAQTNIYREIRRARKYQRPLTVVALAPTQESKSASLTKILQSVQRGAVSRYVDGMLADLLVGQTHDYDVITRCDDHLLLLLPETDAERAEKVVRRISSKAREELGLDLKTGTAEFPTEEITLTGLLDRAGTRLRSQTTEPQEVAPKDGDRLSLEPLSDDPAVPGGVN